MRISMSVSIKIFFRSIIYLAICAVLFLLSNFFLMRFFNASYYLAEFHVASLKARHRRLYSIFLLKLRIHQPAPDICLTRDAGNSSFFKVETSLLSKSGFDLAAVDLEHQHLWLDTRKICAIANSLPSVLP